MQYGILDWILEQLKNINAKPGEICTKFVA